MVLSDYQIDTVSGRSPGTNTLVRVPGPDYIIKDKLGDYALDRAQKVIDGFSEVRLTDHDNLIYGFLSILISTIPNLSLKVAQKLIRLAFQTLLLALWKTGA